MIRKALAILFVTLAGIVSLGAQPAGRPNVVFIFVDDLRPELGCYGNPFVSTPNLDNLASQSLVFVNHYVQVPTCGASRFSLLTGTFPRSREHLRNDAIEKFISPLPESGRPETFIHHLRRNGYYTAGIGKISHSADGLVYPYTGTPVGARRELPHSWDELLFNAGKWETGWNAFFGYADGSNRQSMNGNVKPYELADVSDEGYVDGLTASLAVEKLGELAQRTTPFFMGIGFFKPHLPFNAPRKYHGIYNDGKIPLTSSPDLPANVHPASFHNSGEFNSYRAGAEHPTLSNPLSDAYARTLIKSYYAAISYVDAQVGRVLNALKENHLDKNTIVIVWGDHGWHLGDHRVWGKHTLSERALRSPLMVKVPGKTDRGESTRAVISSVDVYPSLMELCGVNMPYAGDGISFVPLLDHPKRRSVGHAAYSFYNSGISMRTDRFRLTHYLREEQPVTELFDQKRDPDENFNIAHRRPGRVKKLMRLWEKGNTGLYDADR